MRALILTLLALAALVGLFFAAGLDAGLSQWITSTQRDYQNALAAALRGLRAGAPGAVTGFMSICFAYGFLHALGPGHGKAVMGAYAMANDGTLRRMIWLAVTASLAQATVAVLLVHGAILLLGGARDRIEGLATQIEPLSALAIGALGLLLLWRGVRRLRDNRPHHHHHHDAHCGCGHAHAPDADQVRQARNWREMLALVLGIAMRPCTGALFLLLMTWRLQLTGMGIAGVYVMGVGTAMVTALAAAMAVGMRRGVMMSAPSLGRAPVVFAGLEIGLGLLIGLAGVAAFRGGWF